MTKFIVTAIVALFLTHVALGASKAAPAGAPPTVAVATELPARTMNVRINPLGILVGSLSGDFDFRINEKFTLGPSISYMKASNILTDLSGFGIGLRGNWYLTGDALTDSWYVGPMAGYASLSVSSPFLGTESTSRGAFYVGTLVGYQWVWKSGINLNLGLGANFYSGGDSVVASNGVSLDVPYFHGIVPNGELTLGYAF